MSPPGARLAAVPPTRFDRLDALRGFAMLWMAGFHFCFDLNVYGYFHPRQAFTADLFWTLQRACIVTLFLFCAGLSQAVALDAGQAWARFWRRWGQIVVCAVLVSIGSATMFPQSWIYFGVLHGLAVMLVLCRLSAPLRGWLLPLAVVALVLPHVLRPAALNAPAFNWLGLVSREPVTEDWVPLLPWLGVVWLGLLLGQRLLRAHRPFLAASVPALLRPLAALGRWPLSFYMLHQPVLIGAILGGRALGWW